MQTGKSDVLRNLFIDIILDCQCLSFLQNSFMVFSPKVHIYHTPFSSERLKLKTIHKYFSLSLLNKMHLHCIQIFTNTREVTMQVKRATERAMLHKLPTYHEYACACVVHDICVILCFPIVVKSSSTRSLYITFYLCCSKCAMFLCARTPRNAMNRSIESCLLLACSIPTLNDCLLAQCLHLLTVQWHDACVQRLSSCMMPVQSDCPVA